MLSLSALNSGGQYVGWANAVRVWCAREQPAEHDRIDREIVSIAKRRAELDAQEARCLREAERVKIWRHFGFPTLLAYLEDRLGYGPRTAMDRLRVARALGELPELEQALATGVLAYSAVREVVRVATAATEREWIDAVRGKNMRQVEEAVRGRTRGSKPTDPPDPDLVPRRVSFELMPATYALLRQTQTALADEHGGRLDDDQLIATLCRRALEPAGAEPSSARYQIAVTLCRQCERGWQDGGGAAIEIDAAAIEVAQCDARDIGSLDAAHPERATQDVSPATRRFVWQRDHGRCQVPGCRSARNLDIHHIRRRADGGSHEPSNLTILCSACHDGLHRGLLSITGSAPNLTFTRHPPKRSEPAPAAETRPSGERETRSESRLSAAVNRTQVRDALTSLGFRRAESIAATDAAIAHVGSGASFEVLLREALRACPKPTSS
jgi:hypothetical protein